MKGLLQHIQGQARKGSEKDSVEKVRMKCSFVEFSDWIWSENRIACRSNRSDNWPLFDDNFNPYNLDVKARVNLMTKNSRQTQNCVWEQVKQWR